MFHLNKLIINLSIFLIISISCKKTQVSLKMFGDLLTHQKIYKNGKQPDGTYNYDFIFKNIKDEIQKADISLINQEATIAGIKKFPISFFPKFNNRFELADSVAKAGFNVILKANNHAFDLGEEGIKSELNYWKKKYPNIIITGAYTNKKDSEEITIIKKNNIKIAILNYAYGNNFEPENVNKKYMVNILERNKFILQWKKAKNLMCDFIIAVPHWGTEYLTEVDKYQEFWTEIFTILDIDLVIGSHPHVIGPVKNIYNKKTKHNTLIFYSLGNLINASNKKGKGVYRQFCGGMADIVIEKKKKGKTYIKKAKFVPLITHFDKNFNSTVYKVEDYNRKLAKENMVGKYWDDDFSYDKMIEHFKEVVDEKYLDLSFLKKNKKKNQKN